MAVISEIVDKVTASVWSFYSSGTEDVFNFGMDSAVTMPADDE